jgi:hypothetical protein
MAAYKVYRKAIKRASELVGGPYALAARISTPVELIMHWLEDRGTPDEGSFLRCVDIISKQDSDVPWTPAELEAELSARKKL